MHDKRVIELAQIMGRSFIIIPYISQKRIPVEKMIYIGNERSRVCFVRWILMNR